MSDPNERRARLLFLRDLLPNDFSEKEIETEEARLLRIIGLLDRVARRLQAEEKSLSEDIAPDSTTLAAGGMLNYE